MKERGLYKKYNVSKVDDPEGKHLNCNFFVLDLNHDPHARLAIHAYIDSCRKEYPELAYDLGQWLKKHYYGGNDEME